MTRNNFEMKIVDSKQGIILAAFPNFLRFQVKSFKELELFPGEN